MRPLKRPANQRLPSPGACKPTGASKLKAGETRITASVNAPIVGGGLPDPPPPQPPSNSASPHYGQPPPSPSLTIHAAHLAIICGWSRDLHFRGAIGAQLAMAREWSRCLRPAAANGPVTLNAARLIHLVAHRGNAVEFPENTLPAFVSALELGVRFLELDVQLSRDGVPVVIHDDTLLRTTGLPGSVFEHDAAELARIDAAETQRFGDRYVGTHLPLLRDVMRLLTRRPEITLFIEIKRASLTQFGHDQVVSKVLEVIKPWRMQCVIISFDLAAIHRARRLGDAPIGWVLEDSDDHSRLKYEALQPQFLFCDHEKLPASGRLWQGPWRWVIYEVSTLPLALTLAERGADYVETMAVRDMSDALRGRRAAL